MTIKIPLGWSVYQRHLLELSSNPNILLFGDRDSQSSAHLEQIIEYLDLNYLSRFKIYTFDQENNYDPNSKKIVKFNTVFELDKILNCLEEDKKSIVVINHIEDLVEDDKKILLLIQRIKEHANCYLIASASKLSSEVIAEFKTLLIYKISNADLAKELTGSTLPTELEPRQFIYGKNPEVHVIDEDRQSFKINYDNVSRFAKLHYDEYKNDLKKELSENLYNYLDKYDLIDQYLHMFLYRCDRRINFEDILYYLKRYELCGYIRQTIKNLNEIKVHNLNDQKINIIYLTITCSHNMELDEFEPFENYFQYLYGPYTLVYFHNNYGIDLKEDEFYIEAFLFYQAREEMFKKPHHGDFNFMSIEGIPQKIVPNIISDYYVQGKVSKDYLMKTYDLTEEEAQKVKEAMEIKL